MKPGPLLADARRRAGLTQAELAERMGVSQPAVAKLEREESNPTVRTLERALQATGHRIEARRALPPAERIRRLEREAAEIAKIVAAGARAWRAVLSSVR